MCKRDRANEPAFTYMWWTRGRAGDKAPYGLGHHDNFATFNCQLGANTEHRLTNERRFEL